VTPARPFTRAEATAFLAFADSVLALPPSRPWIERHPGRGRVVLRFALTLAMAAPQNRSRHAQGWQMARERSSVLSAMAGQLAWQVTVRGPDGVFAVPMQLGWCKHGRGIIPTWPAPLTGRPMVRAIRFSSVAPDPTAAWHKCAIDCLRVPRQRAGKLVPGLGVLVDDRPALLELREWHEPAPKGQGGAIIEVWTGEEMTDVR